MTPQPTPNRELAEYLSRRLDYLQRTCAVVEDQLIDRPLRDLCERADRGEIVPNGPEVQRAYREIEFIVGNTLRYTLLVGVCSFLEEALKVLSARLVSDYESRWKKLKKEQVSDFEKHCRILTDARIVLQPIRSELDRFAAFSTLRNNVVHQWGNVADAKDRVKLESAVKQISGVSVTEDGRLLFDDVVVPGAIVAADDIVRYLVGILGASFSRRSLSITNE